MVVQVVVLSANGEARQSRITSGEVTAATVTKLCRKTRSAATIGTYEFGELTLTVWGWTEGKASTENKHELPAPLDEGELFGDVVVSATATADDAAMGLTVAMWEKFCKEVVSGSGDEESDEDDAVVDGEIPDDLEEEDVDEEADGEDTEAPAEEAEEEDDADGEADEEDEEDGDEADGEDGDCYEDGDEGGGGKRRAPRKRTATAPEYRRFDMGLKSHIKVPMPVGKRAPRWQTAPELVEEPY